MAKRTSTRRPQELPAKKTVEADGRVTYVHYTRKLAKTICARLATGETWFRMANTPGMPCYTSLYAWRQKYPEFAEAYAQAKEMAADLRADRTLEVAEAATSATASADRLRIGALQWHAGKAAPKRYGTRVRDEDGVEEGPERRLIIEVRRFAKATAPDGTLYTREIFPDGRIEGPEEAKG